MQYFQGEQINITINGSSGYNLENIDFGCVIYPINDISKALRVVKADMTKLADNQYVAAFVSSKTKLLPIGLYNIEMYDDSNDLIYQKKGAFNVNTCASKDFITSNS